MALRTSSVCKGRGWEGRVGEGRGGEGRVGEGRGGEGGEGWGGEGENRVLQPAQSVRLRASIIIITPHPLLISPDEFRTFALRPSGVSLMFFSGDNIRSATHIKITHVIWWIGILYRTSTLVPSI